MTTRVVVHDHNHDVFVGILKAQAWAAIMIRISPPHDLIDRMTIVIPYPLEAHRQAPFTSLPTILNNFFYFFFSKSISYFPCSTYLLTVSRLYLTLDKIYNLIWGYISKQPNLQISSHGATRSNHDKALTLSDASKEFKPGLPLRLLIHIVIQTLQIVNF